jgi:hypothetical protein
MNLFFISIADKGSSASLWPRNLLMGLYTFEASDNAAITSNASTNTKNAKQQQARPKLRLSSWRLTPLRCPSALLPVDDDLGANFNGASDTGTKISACGSQWIRLTEILLTPGLTLPDEKYQQVESSCTSRKAGSQQTPDPASTGSLSYISSCHGGRRRCAILMAPKQ